MTDAFSSFGTFLKKGDGGTPETFATIAEVGDIDGPDMSLATEETTHHGSVNGWDEFVGTILSGGEVSFPVNFLPSDPTQDGVTGLQADMKNRTKRNFQIVYPDPGANGFAFKALVTGCKPKAPVKGKLSADVKLKITGPVTEI
jgi:hypothetical protein